MIQVRICDRCKEPFNVLQEMSTREGMEDDEWLLYTITKDCHPNHDVEIDLCMKCRKSLIEWLKGDRK